VRNPPLHWFDPNIPRSRHTHKGGRERERERGWERERERRADGRGKEGFEEF
jgi:hypothetical protein